MTFHMDVANQERRPVGRKPRNAHLMPMWVVVLLVVALLVACSFMALVLAVSLVAAAGSALVGGVLALAFVAVVHSVTPAAFIIIAARCVGVALVARVVPALFEVILVAELAFYAYYRVKSARLSRVKARGPRMAKDERWLHFRRVLAATPDMCAYFRGWFVGKPPLAALRKGNVLEWLAWAFFDDSVDVMSRDEVAEMEAMLKEVTATHGISFSPGYNPDVTSVRLSLDSHRALHRPLIYYAIIYTMDFGAKLAMWGMGFRRYTLAGNTVFYWYRPAPPPGTSGTGLFNVIAAASWRFWPVVPLLRLFGVPATGSDGSGVRASAPRRRRGAPARSGRPAAVAGAKARPRATTTPREMLAPAGDGSGSSSDSDDGGSGSDSPNHVVLFFHGIGIGISAYLPLVWSLLRLRQAVCVMEVPCISTRLVSSFTRRSHVVGAVGSMLHAHGHSKVTLVGHSFGTIHSAWVIRAMPELVLGSVLLDPVTLMLAEPEVCCHFMYRKPSNVDEFATYYMASTELHVSHSIARHFFWHENILWYEHLPHKGTKTSVLLSGSDGIVPSAKIREYLAARGVHTMWYPALTHGSFLASGAIRWRVIQAVARHHGCLEHLVQDVATDSLVWMADDWLAGGQLQVDAAADVARRSD